MSIVSSYLAYLDHATRARGKSANIEIYIGFHILNIQIIFLHVSIESRNGS